MTEPAFGSSTLDRYERKQLLGHGAYGKVYFAIDRTTQEPLALKKIILDTEAEGIPSVALREIMLLREVNCPYVVKLRNVVSSEKKVYLVFEYVEKDLKRFLEEREGKLSAGEVKRMMFQLVSAVAYLHSRRIIHRDLKPQNILISNSGAIKLADFGLARMFQIPLRPYTQGVVTLWYRPPELLLGAVEYSPAVDIWSLGVIFAEIVTKAPLFSGETEMDQLYRVFRTMGTPSERVWPGVTRLKKYKPTFPNWPPNPLTVPGLDADGLDLIKSMLRYNPADRCTAREALRHPYFAGVQNHNVSS